MNLICFHIFQRIKFRHKCKVIRTVRMKDIYTNFQMAQLRDLALQSEQDFAGFLHIMWVFELKKNNVCYHSIPSIHFSNINFLTGVRISFMYSEAAVFKSIGWSFFSPKSATSASSFS